jgi:hypothetical protein
MKKYLYTGMPTFNKNSKDIKIPKSNGSFLLIKDVIPNQTVIEIDDLKSIEFCEKNLFFSEVVEG